MQKPKITTNIIHGNRSSYVRELMSLWFNRTGIWFIPVPLIAVVAGLTYNNAFLYLAAIIIFLIYPFGLMMVYFNYALEKRTSLLGIFPHTVCFGETEIDIVYHPLTSEDEEGNVTVVRKAPASETIPYTKIKNISVTAGKTVIEGPDAYRLLIVPSNSFKSDNDCLEIQNFLLNENS